MTHRGPFQPLLFCDSVILYWNVCSRICQEFCQLLSRSNWDWNVQAIIMYPLVGFHLLDRETRLSSRHCLFFDQERKGLLFFLGAGSGVWVFGMFSFPSFISVLATGSCFSAASQSCQLSRTHSSENLGNGFILFFCK